MAEIKTQDLPAATFENYGSLIAAVEEEVGHSHGAWDLVTPEELVRAVLLKAPESLRAPSQPVGVPEGWKLVPIKCTEAMKDVGYPFEFSTISDGRLLAQSMWNELLAASPTPPAAQAIAALTAQEEDELERQVVNISDSAEEAAHYGVRLGYQEAIRRLSAAPAAAGDEVKPMTDEQIEHIRQNEPSQGEIASLEWHVDFARAIERHHGIVASAEAGKVGG